MCGAGTRTASSRKRQSPRRRFVCRLHFRATFILKQRVLGEKVPNLKIGSLSWVSAPLNAASASFTRPKASSMMRGYPSRTFRSGLIAGGVEFPATFRAAVGRQLAEQIPAAKAERRIRVEW
jgi:hypothetical protein